ncbi:unnamed protein product [Sphagnum troendelagicum]|uniref:Uncharacterized protein n=1 Tax=Sphagnum troendelagicum TaxID=128251 RepID=A0ABP0TCR1_9BRYO
MPFPFTECSCGCDGKSKQEREGIKCPDTAVMPPVVLSDRHQHSGVKGVLQKHSALEHQCLVKLTRMFLKDFPNTLPAECFSFWQKNLTI